MKILIADKLEAEALDGLAGLGAEVISRPGTNGEALVAAAAQVKPAALVVRSTKVPAAVMDAAGPGLRLVVRAGAGYDTIDTEAARARGVGVCNCPGMNAVAVAELTMGHLINLDRRLVEQDAELKAGRWDKAQFGRARGLKGRRLLVIGTGAIGLEVIKRARAFEMEVFAQSRSLTESMAAALGVGWVAYSRQALHAALPGFDAVTIHVAVVEDTKEMADRAFFEAMKPGGFFINTSRGGVVDDAALAWAIAERGIRAGLDVYNGQPAESKAAWAGGLAMMKGVTGTHHCGASTEQAQLAVAEEVVRIVGAFMKTGAFTHCVNGLG